MPHDFTDLENYLERIQRDEALVNSFRARHPALVRLCVQLFAEPEQSVTLTNCPSYADLTALQLTLFDNHKHAQRGQRWGANLKAWTVDRINFKRPPQWSANVTLWERKEAVKRAEKLTSPKLRNPISDETVALLSALVENRPSGMFGIAKHMTPADGTIYFDAHVLWADVRDGCVLAADLYSEDCSLSFPPFVTTDANNSPLRDKAVAQSRHSDAESLANWATGAGVHL